MGQAMRCRSSGPRSDLLAQFARAMLLELGCLLGWLVGWLVGLLGWLTRGCLWHYSLCKRTWRVQQFAGPNFNHMVEMSTVPLLYSGSSPTQRVQQWQFSLVVFSAQLASPRCSASLLGVPATARLGPPSRGAGNPVWLAYKPAQSLRPEKYVFHSGGFVWSNPGVTLRCRLGWVTDASIAF